MQPTRARSPRSRQSAPDASRAARRWIGSALAATFLLQAASALADEPAPAGWTFSIAPYLWATSLDGDLKLRGRSVDVDASFQDILKESDSIIGIEGHGEAWNGDWGLYIDGVYNRIDTEDAADVDALIDIKLENVTELSIVEAGLLYRIGKWPLASGWSGSAPDGPTLELDAYGGARYTALDVENKVTIGPLTFKEDGSKDWVDPFLGARAILNLDRHWRLMLGGDVGGFGVGSDFTWSALGLVGYQYELFGLDLTSVFGYKALYQDYEDGSGSNRFEWDMTLHGPIMGTIVRF